MQRRDPLSPAADWLTPPPAPPPGSACPAWPLVPTHSSYLSIPAAMVESGDLRGPSPSPPVGLTAYRGSPPAPAPPPLLFSHPYLYPALPCFAGALYPLPGLLRGRHGPLPPSGHAAGPVSPPRRPDNPFSMDVILGRRPAEAAGIAASGHGIGGIQLHTDLFGE